MEVRVFRVATFLNEMLCQMWFPRNSRNIQFSIIQILTSMITPILQYSLQLADSPKFLEIRIETMTRLNGFLSIYFKHLEFFKLL